MFSVTFYFPIFFLQLDAVTHGIDGTFSFYSVRLPVLSSTLIDLTPNSLVQLVIMNASSFVGRIVPGFLAHSLGIANMATASAGCGAVLVLGMIGLSNIASVVVLAILYGFCSGICGCSFPDPTSNVTHCGIFHFYLSYYNDGAAGGRPD
jgi:hypothetical protein